MDNEKDIAIIGAMMKVTHIFAIKAVININNFEKGLEIKNTICAIDYKNIRVQCMLIHFYGHFNDTINALKLFECINEIELNVVCIGSIIKALIDNELNKMALEI